MYAVADQLPRLGKRELICLLSFTCNMWFLFGEVSSSSWCLGWAALFYCGIPWIWDIIILNVYRVDSLTSWRSINQLNIATTEYDGEAYKFNPHLIVCSSCDRSFAC